MKPTRGYRQRLATIRRLMEAGDYRSALNEVAALSDDWPGAAPLHVLRARLIQLQEEDNDRTPSLEEAKTVLKRAIDLDDPSLSPLLEQAHYQFAVEDDAKAALQTFKKAAQAYKEVLIEALLGQAAALEELGRREEAFDCLSQARLLQTAINGDAARQPWSEQLLQRWNELAEAK
jgi:tetratricopeptide (TPR) repeat protein